MDLTKGKPAVTMTLRTVMPGSNLSAPSQTVFCYPLATAYPFTDTTRCSWSTPTAGNRLKVRKLPGYHEHRVVSFCPTEDLKMPGSTNPADVAFLKECQDLMALVDLTERLLHSGRRITPLAAAQMAATRQEREERAARRAARRV